MSDREKTEYVIQLYASVGGWHDIASFFKPMRAVKAFIGLEREHRGSELRIVCRYTKEKVILCHDRTKK